MGALIRNGDVSSNQQQMGLLPKPLNAFTALVFFSSHIN